MNHVLFFCKIWKVEHLSADTSICSLFKYLYNSRFCSLAISLFLAKRTRSSAKVRTDIFSPPSFMPSVVSSNIPIMESSIKLNNNGDCGSPYLTPLNMWYLFVIFAIYYHFTSIVHVLDVFT